MGQKNTNDIYPPNLNAWKFRLYMSPAPDCRFCHEEQEIGEHIVFECRKIDRSSVLVEGTKRRWESWREPVVKSSHHSTINQTYIANTTVPKASTRVRNSYYGMYF